jgi:hypothetical protein
MAICGLYAVSTLPISVETQAQDAANLLMHRNFWRTLFTKRMEVGVSLYDEVVKATLHLVGRFEIGFEAAKSADHDPEDKVREPIGTPYLLRVWASKSSPWRGPVA